MGLLSWLFPSDEDRVRRARDLLASDRAADARYEVLEIDTDDAREVLSQAEQQLARMNLDAAISWANAGDDRRVQVHLELAEEYHKGGLEEEFRAARRQMRELRMARSTAEEAARREREHKQMAADPLGLTGGANWLQQPVADDLYDPDREDIEARLALIVDGYAEDLRERFGTLGADFAKAVLDLNDGRMDRALQALLALPDSEPLVRWERARCCHALGDARAAAREVRSFAELAGGHRSMGNQHSGELLAQLLIEQGDTQGALRLVRSLRSTEPERAGPMFAQLLIATGQHEEAEGVLVGLVRAHPRTQFLYALLAQNRLAGNQRAGAIRALEASQEAICCTPGKCGSQPPRQDILRMLATLYLEEGIQTDKAMVLAAQALGMVKKPQWEDLYLRALVAHQERAPDFPDIAERLRSLTPAALLSRVDTYLPAAPNLRPA